MNHADEFTVTQRHYLMAAYLLNMGPKTDVRIANTIHLFYQVVIWSGVPKNEILIECDDPNPRCMEIYQVLIDMVRGGQLFKSAGKWGKIGDTAFTASWPRYNSCCLTEYGWQVASELHQQHPECVLVAKLKSSRLA